MASARADPRQGFAGFLRPFPVEVPEAPVPVDPSVPPRQAPVGPEAYG
ncbi:MAG TPA: hypothetical protein VE152_07415 [Acidimicrobiales bacterium]|nr:hypothetical protein [Acidimicrobiales bacterium]